MSKYIFATKFKKIEKEKEPLYYNLQLTVDKDCDASQFDILAPGLENIHFYKNSPIILTPTFEAYEKEWKSSEEYDIHIIKPSTFTNLNLLGTHFFTICEGYYPLPEIVSVVKNGVTFTFTPIPVYEPLYYNIQLTVDKDVRIKTGADISDDGYYTFYANKPIILTKTVSQEEWTYEERCLIRFNREFINLYADFIHILTICEGYYPFPEIIQVDHYGTIFTFTPIPVYE